MFYRVTKMFNRVANMSKQFIGRNSQFLYTSGFFVSNIYIVSHLLKSERNIYLSDKKGEPQFLLPIESSWLAVDDYRRTMPNKKYIVRHEEYYDIENDKTYQQLYAYQKGNHTVRNVIATSVSPGQANVVNKYLTVQNEKMLVECLKKD